MKKKRKEFFKEMQERREQKRLRLLSNFYSSKSADTLSQEMKQESERLRKDLQRNKEEESLKKLCDLNNKKTAPHPLSAFEISQESLPKSNLVFINHVPEMKGKPQPSQSDSSWPEHIVALIATKNTEPVKQKIESTPTQKTKN